eukprot:TRINITY_DN19733_c0_g1_i1.p1 TRINITY_DN19733_c0_g1~~TRINITY_DN19733_c0_g1_i1.p1  ORF type:complete len:629 (-),score=152.61 TRINITY_DN19733_c0_g1_i1:166-2052(-)
MSTYYLSTEPDEFFIARQTNRLKYFQNEIDSLHDQIADLFEMLRLNQQALKLSLPPEEHEVEETDGVIESLFAENERLLALVQQYAKERDILHRRALINEQIAEEASRHEREVISELEEQYSDLRRLLAEKETTIHELEKNKHIFESENVVVKYKEIGDKDDQNLLLNKEISLLHASLDELSKTHSHLVFANHELKNLNSVLANDLLKVKAALFAPTVCSPVVRRTIFSIRRARSQDSYVYRGTAPSIPGHKQEEQRPQNEPIRPNSPGRAPAVVPKLNLSRTQSAKPDNVRVQMDNKNGKEVRPERTNPSSPKSANQGKISRVDEFIRLTKEKDKYLILYRNEVRKNERLREEIEATITSLEALSSDNDRLIGLYRRNTDVTERLNYRVKFFKELHAKYVQIVSNPKADRNHELKSLLHGLLRKFGLTKRDLEEPVDDYLKSAGVTLGMSQGFSHHDVRNKRIPDRFETMPAFVEDLEEERPGVRTMAQVSAEKKRAAPTENISLGQAKAHMLGLAKELEFLSSIPVSELTKRYLSKLEKCGGIVVNHRKSASDIVQMTRDNDLGIAVTPTKRANVSPIPSAEKLPTARRAINQSINDSQFDMSFILNTTNVNLDANIDLSFILDSK